MLKLRSLITFIHVVRLCSLIEVVVSTGAARVPVINHLSHVRVHVHVRMQVHVRIHFHFTLLIIAHHIVVRDVGITLMYFWSGKATRREWGYGGVSRGFRRRSTGGTTSSATRKSRGQ